MFLFSRVLFFLIYHYLEGRFFCVEKWWPLMFGCTVVMMNGKIILYMYGLVGSL